MPKSEYQLIALAVAMLSASAAWAETAPDDRSYLPPQNLQAQKTDVNAAPARRASTAHNSANRRTRGHSLSGILASLFR
jgi:hypothetical protein